MQAQQAQCHSTPLRFKQFVRSLGPGIMMATAAVGGSHLVASTKAGAIYGWQLAAVILLVNLFKYPFFRAGIHYTMGTGQSLIQGYAQMGKGYLWLFTLLNVASAVVNTAALLLFSASLFGYFLPVQLPLTLLASFVLLACLAILLVGHYQALDKLSKWIMAILVVATLAAVIVAAQQGGVAQHEPPPGPDGCANDGQSSSGDGCGREEHPERGLGRSKNEQRHDGQDMHRDLRPDDPSLTLTVDQHRHRGRDERAHQDVGRVDGTGCEVRVGDGDHQQKEREPAHRQWEPCEEPGN